MLEPQGPALPTTAFRPCCQAISAKFQHLSTPSSNPPSDTSLPLMRNVSLPMQQQQPHQGQSSHPPPNPSQLGGSFFSHQGGVESLFLSMLVRSDAAVAGYVNVGKEVCCHIQASKLHNLIFHQLLVSWLLITEIDPMRSRLPWLGMKQPWRPVSNIKPQVDRYTMPSGRCHLSMRALATNVSHAGGQMELDIWELMAGQSYLFTLWDIISGQWLPYVKKSSCYH